MADWSDTVTDRFNGDVVGFTASNETIDSAQSAAAPGDQPIEDVRRVAVENTEAAGVEVVDTPQPPADNNEPLTAPVGNVESHLGDEGNASSEGSSTTDDTHSSNQ